MTVFRHTANPAASTWTTLMSTDAGEEAVISSVTASNTSTTASAGVYVYVRPTAASRTIAHSVVYIVALQPVTAANMHRLSLIEGICVPPAHTVEVYATTADCVFAVNGEAAAV